MDALDKLKQWVEEMIEGEETDFPQSDSPRELASDLIVVEKMASQLQDYLFQDDLFWQIVVDTPGGVRRPKMTLGALWERMADLRESEALGPSDQQRLDKAFSAWETARRRYPERFRRHLRQELDSYRHNWEYFLRNREDRDAEQWEEDYEVEVRNRERVELVLRLLDQDAPGDVLSELDELEAEVRAG